MAEEQIPNYFAGKRRRAVIPDPPSGEPQAAEEMDVATLRGQFKLSPDSDVQELAMRSSLPPKAPPRVKDQYTDDGTYIPLSGGMRGWYGNSGVLNCEMRNGYRYRDAVDDDAFKKVILERIESFNRRSIMRMKVDLWATFTPAEGGGAPVQAFCVDLSVLGARLRTRHEVNMDSWLVICLYPDQKSIEETEPLAMGMAQVTNLRRASPPRSEPRFYVGIEFHDLEIAAKEDIARLSAKGVPLPERQAKL